MVEGKPSAKTKKKVWERWKGKCAFCGIDLPIDQHHIFALSKDPELADNPENLILLCSNHHGLTQKKKPDGFAALSVTDIKDLKQSKFAHIEKTGFYLKVPQNFAVNLGGNICSECPYVLVVNKKPLIEIWPQKPVHYVNEVRIYLYMRLFDEKNNFIGGMFANHWATVADEDWELRISDKLIEATNRSKPLNMKFEVKDNVVHITGVFYRDGIKIAAEEEKVILPGNNIFVGNKVSGCEVAFAIEGSSIGVCGRL